MPFQAAEVIWAACPCRPRSGCATRSFQPGSKSPAPAVLAECQVAVGVVRLKAERAHRAGDGVLAVIRSVNTNDRLTRWSRILRIEPDRSLPDAQRILHAIHRGRERAEVGAQLATPGRVVTARSNSEMPRSGSLVCAAIIARRASAGALSGAAPSTSLQMPAASPKRLACAAAWARARAWSRCLGGRGGGGRSGSAHAASIVRVRPVRSRCLS
jgi:hypothetical protein